MISELSQPARIASLECGLAKIPCLPEGSVSNLGASRMNFIAYLAGGRIGRSFFLLYPAVFLAVTLVQKNPPARSVDAPLLIWDIDLRLARLCRVTSAQLVIRLKRAMAKPLRPMD
jgi:hypothetical protein